MNRVHAPPEESYVVRISGVDPHDPERWRATVVHVATGERRYVTTYGDLCGFIESHRLRTARGSD